MYATRRSCINSAVAVAATQEIKYPFNRYKILASFILRVSLDVLCSSMFHRMLLIRYFIISGNVLSLNFNK
jgi:hypothetical protein